MHTIFEIAETPAVEANQSPEVNVGEEAPAQAAVGMGNGATPAPESQIVNELGYTFPVEHSVSRPAALQHDITMQKTSVAGSKGEGVVPVAEEADEEEGRQPIISKRPTPRDVPKVSIPPRPRDPVTRPCVQLENKLERARKEVQPGLKGRVNADNALAVAKQTIPNKSVRCPVFWVVPPKIGARFPHLFLTCSVWPGDVYEGTEDVNKWVINSEDEGDVLIKIWRTEESEDENDEPIFCKAKYSDLYSELARKPNNKDIDWRKQGFKQLQEYEKVQAHREDDQGCKARKRSRETCTYKHHVKNIQTRIRKAIMIAQCAPLPSPVIPTPPQTPQQEPTRKRKREEPAVTPSSYSEAVKAEMPDREEASQNAVEMLMISSETEFLLG